MLFVFVLQDSWKGCEYRDEMELGGSWEGCVIERVSSDVWGTVFAVV